VYSGNFVAFRNPRHRHSSVYDLGHLFVGIFSPQNAPKPFGDRALCSLRPISWLQGVDPRKGLGGEGEEGRRRGWTPQFLKCDSAPGT